MLGNNSFMAKLVARLWISFCSSVSPDDMSRLVTKGGMLLASSQSADSDEVDCCRSEGRHRLREGARRMRPRGREAMMVVVVVDREEGEGFSLVEVNQAIKA